MWRRYDAAGTVPVNCGLLHAPSSIGNLSIRPPSGRHTRRGGAPAAPARAPVESAAGAGAGASFAGRVGRLPRLRERPGDRDLTPTWFTTRIDVAQGRDEELVPEGRAVLAVVEDRHRDVVALFNPLALSAGQAGPAGIYSLLMTSSIV